jgi:type I restriction enzyme M protein
MAAQEDLLRQTERSLFQACDILRRSINFSNAIVFIFGLLFLKKISSADEESDEQNSNHNKDQNREIKHKKFNIPNISNWKHFSNQDINIATALTNAVDALEETNPIFSGSLKEIVNWHAKVLRDNDLAAVLKIVDDLSNDDESINETCNVLINVIGPTSREWGEFCTPQDINSLMVSIANPKADSSIYDPTIGNGGLMIQVANFISTKSNNIQNTTFFGQEINKYIWAFCKINLLFNNLWNANIELGDTLSDPKFIEEDSVKKFDFVITNPPFSLRQNKTHFKFEERFVYGDTQIGDLMLIQHMIASLKTTGTIVTAVSNGVLFRSGSEKDIRKNIVEANLIDAIIALPSKILYHTNIPITLLVLKKNKTDKNILIINAAEEFVEKNLKRNEITDKNIRNILSIYQDRKQVEGISKLLPIEDLSENDYNLNPSRYINSRLDLYINKYKWSNLELVTLNSVCDNIATNTTSAVNNNSIYIPKFATAHVFSDLEEIPIGKRKNYFSAEIKSNHNHRYIAYFLNSDNGKELRSIAASGFIPSFNLKSIRELFVYAPGIPKEDEILSNYLLLDSLTSKMESLKSDILGVQSRETITKDLKKIISTDPLQYLSDELPFPIASILARATNEADPYKQYTLFLNYFEALAIFLTTIQLSGIVNASEETQEKIKQIINQKQSFEQWFTNAAFGNWTTTLLNVGKLIRSTPNLSEAFCNSQTFIDSLDSKKLLPILEEISVKRNDKSHGGLNQDDYYKKECVVLRQQIVQTGDILLKMFQSTQLIMPKPKATDFKAQKYHTDSYLLMGSNPNFKVIDCITNKGDVSAYDLYLLELGSEKPLRLIPFIQMGASLQSERNAAYFYNRLEKESAKYVSYSSTEVGNVSIDKAGIVEILEYFSKKLYS